MKSRPSHGFYTDPAGEPSLQPPLLPEKFLDICFFFVYHMCVVYSDSVVEASSNGRIAVSKTVNEGSNPSASVESKSSEAIYILGLRAFSVFTNRF